ncbi:MAG: DUF721 domain-containing protein [Sphaerochaetaceae bacterium]|nr:DUF721 domain-containing protein [Sphaerochaetaceae bacterium]
MIKKDKYEPISPDDPLEGKMYIDKIMERYGINLNDSATQLKIQWSNIIGKEYSPYCKCGGVKNGTLFIYCDNGLRATALRLNIKEHIKKINTTFPELEVKRASIRVKTINEDSKTT